MRPKSHPSTYPIYFLRFLTSKELKGSLKRFRMLIANSVVTNFLFAHQTDMLADEKMASGARNNSKALLMGVHVNKHLPWIPDFLESLPLMISKPMMPPGLIDMLELFDVSIHPDRTCGIAF